MLVLVVVLIFDVCAAQAQETPNYGRVFTFNHKGNIPKIGAVPDRLRSIKYNDQITGNRLTFLTNQFALNGLQSQYTC